MKHPRLLRGTFAASVVAGAVLACYGPTEVVVELRTDLHARNPRTLIRVAGTTATKDGATGDGRIGELVLVPSSARDAPVEISVVTSVDGRSPDDCEASPDKTGCVFARRRFKFAPHESRSFVVFMSSVCLGKDCGTQTCEDGVCVAPSENKSDDGKGGDPIPPDATTLDGATDGAVADVATEGGIDPLCPPTQRLVTNQANPVPNTLAVNAARIHWIETAKTPTIAWIANTPGATTIDFTTGDTYAIDPLSIVSTNVGTGMLRRTTFPPGGGVGSMECPTDAVGGLASLTGITPGVYVTQNGAISRVTTFDPGGCGLSPVTTPKGGFSQLWGTKDHLYAVTDAKSLSRVVPKMSAPSVEEVFGALPSYFATDGQAVAFTDPEARTIFYIDPASVTKEPPQFAQLTESLRGLAMDANYIYWLEPQPGSLSGGVVALFRGERKVVGMVPELIGRYAEAHSLAADDRCIYLYGREIARGLNARTGLFARPKTWIPTKN